MILVHDYGFRHSFFSLFPWCSSLSISTLSHYYVRVVDSVPLLRLWKLRAIIVVVSLYTCPLGERWMGICPLRMAVKRAWCHKDKRVFWPPKTPLQWGTSWAHITTPTIGVFMGTYHPYFYLLLSCHDSLSFLYFYFYFLSFFVFYVGDKGAPNSLPCIETEYGVWR